MIWRSLTGVVKLFDVFVDGVIGTSAMHCRGNKTDSALTNWITSGSAPDHQLPMKWSILKRMLAASLTAVEFIAPNPT